MYEIDKNAFAAFLTQRRKEKGWTQKELAGKLFVSDKAVSKWERGLSLPDISLLVPMAEILEVSVTELLEGRKMPQEMDAGQVEELVKKAIHLSERDPETEKKRLKKHACIFLAAGAVVALEKMLIHVMGASRGFEGYQILEVLSVGFGVYFWFFMQEKLPAYYDQNRISVFADGPVRMNLPGVSFNNTNWPYIVKTLRIWSIVTMVTLPLVSLGLFLLPEDLGTGLAVQMAVLLLYLAGLMVPVYVVARKYGDAQKPDRRFWVTAAAVAILFGVLLFQGTGTLSSGIEIGSRESGGLRQYSIRYMRFTGTKQKILYPKDPPAAYILQVETQEGTVSVEIREADNVIFSEEAMQTGTWLITLEDTAYVTVRADGHKGSISILPAE